MQRLAAEVARRRIRLKELFLDFDRLRTGYVTCEQWVRVLSAVDVYKLLTEQSKQELQAQFSSGPERFAYNQFLAVLENAESEHERDRDMDAATLHVLETILRQVHASGLEVRSAFRDFDKHNTGKISSSQFARSLPFRLEPRDVKLLGDRYATGNGEANYAAFCRELNQLAAQQANANGTVVAQSPTSRTKAHKISAQAAMTQLQHQAQTHSIRMEDCFRDFDKTHCGVIKPGQFCSALGSVKLRGVVMNQEVLQNLVDAYATPDGHVCYARFLADLETCGSPVAAQQTTQSENPRVRVILDKVRTAIRTRRMNLKPTFQDFDRATKGIYVSLSCTRRRFERALSINGIRLSTAEIDLLEDVYAVQSTTEADADAINYVAFCRDVDMTDAATETPGAPQTASVQRARATADAPSLRTVLDAAMLQIASRSIRLHEFIRDHDPLRTGQITKDKLETAISISGLKLTPAMVQVLQQEYESSTDPKCVRYQPLLAALDADAEGENDKTIRKVDEVRARVALEATQTTESVHSAQLDLILQRIRDDVASRQILLPPFFQDYDKHHRGCITAAQFDRVLCRHRLPVSPADLDVLKQYFADPTDATHVRCRDFIAAVDATEASRKRVTDASGPVAASPRAAAQPPVSVDQVLAKVRTVLRTRSVRVNEFFRDADQLRKGYCTSNKFGGCLDALGIHLTGAELDALIENYASSRAPSAVEYARFVADAENDDFAATASTEPDVAGAVASDPFLQGVVRKVKSATTTRNMSLRASLQDFDKLRKGRITATQFFSALSTLNIRFNALETSKITEVLSCGGGQVHYAAFCCLIE